MRSPRTHHTPTAFRKRDQEAGLVTRKTLYEGASPIFWISTGSGSLGIKPAWHQVRPGEGPKGEDGVSDYMS